MAGLRLGGLSDEASQRLLAKASSMRPAVTLTAAGQRFVLDPATIGYRIDVSASVARARQAGRRGAAFGVGSTIPSFLRSRQLEPVARIDRLRLAAQIDAIAQTIDRPARAGAFALTEARRPESVSRRRGRSAGCSARRLAAHSCARCAIVVWGSRRRPVAGREQGST